jgi:DNA-binding XRE family transcriptional regulator
MMAVEVTMFTGGQLRAARAYAKLSAVELAELAGVGRSTIIKAESVDDIPALTVKKLITIKEALENIGITFGQDGSVNYRPPKKA